jgi:hypothetical protein
MPKFSLSRTHPHIQWHDPEFNPVRKVVDSGWQEESVTDLCEFVRTPGPFFGKYRHRKVPPHNTVDRIDRIHDPRRAVNVVFLWKDKSRDPNFGILADCC